MPPKKKEEEIDLATLPQCHSINVMVLAKGKKGRATTLLQKIQKEAEKYLFKIKKSEVLDHAKDKNIYIDPTTLTDKQKKDPKFMESVCTELTPEVMAKAVQSHITALNTKIRIEKKNNPAPFANQKRKYDVLYTFQDFPESREEYEELAKIQEGIKYVLVVNPKITWASAPELPQANQDDGQEEEDEEIKEYKNLLAKQQKTQEDRQYEKNVNLKLETLKTLRSQSSPASEFRNCTISILDHEIDPYNEENTQNELVKAFFENIMRLDGQFVQFQEWKKGRKAEPMPQKSAEANKKLKDEMKKGFIVDMLDDLARGIDENQVKVEVKTNEEEDVLGLIDSFSAGKKKKTKSAGAEKKVSGLNFIGGNEEIGPDSRLKNELRSQIKFPGIDRYQMPEVPSKSEGLRKLQQSHYSQFLPPSMPLQQFFRRQRLSNFEDFIRQFDQERAYTFSDRIYEEQHDRSSLQRELYKAGENGEASVFTKYDEATDKLYLMMVYRNNGRRVARKNWESSWKVIPNYESWLNYFKNNEGNLNNNTFYDLDYEKIGNIQEVCRTFTLKNGRTGAVIIDKECSAGNNTQKMLYSIKNQLVFGVNKNKFYSQHESVKAFHHRIGDEGEEYETVVILDDGKIRVSSAGTVAFEQGEDTRLITPDGYTIIYDHDKSVILHPNGGVTYSKDTYVNERGFGLKQGHLFRSLALERTTDNGKIIKREDGTVIVSKTGDNSSRWIKFYEGTEYQMVDDQIKIEKAGKPFVTCSGGLIKVVTKELVITVTPNAGYYQSTVEFKDGSLLTMNNAEVLVSQKDEEEVIKISVDKNQISSAFDKEEVTVTTNSAKYKRNGREVDALEDEQKYGDDDTLPPDCIEPRLFVINNDNTGVQLISDNIVQAYLSNHQHQIQQILQNKKQNKVECQIIEKVDKKLKKYIKNDLVIKLDVFDNSQPPASQSSIENISIRTLIKYPPLSPEDISQIAKIKAEVDSWKKSTLKEQNQFGHKSKDNELIRSKIAGKMLSIRTRKQNEPLINVDNSREKGKKMYLGTLKELKSQEDEKVREAQLRHQYMKKKNSVVIGYRSVDYEGKKQQREEEHDEELGPFLDHYFMTSQGKKALSEMPEWVFRPKNIKQAIELDPEIQNELNNTNLNRQQENSEEHRQRYDTVEINLNPKLEKQILIKPSVFTQREIDEERQAFEVEKKAYKYHEIKRKDFDVYGLERRSRPEVRTLLRTQAISEINQKYLVTEAPLDKKVKISSMKNKLTSSASSMTEMRKEGPHSLLMKTLDKGNDVNKLLQKRTMMVQADLNDKLQRDILINPVQVNFGVLLERKSYQFKIDIKNQDIISQRITLKRPRSIYVKVALSEMGPIAMGMTRRVIVTLKAASELLGKFTDEFDIVTKHEIYHIPVVAHIISENQLKNETLALSKGVNELQETFRKKGEASVELPRLK